MNTKFCSKCGTGAPSETKFCTNCGSDQFSIAMAATQSSPVAPVPGAVTPVQAVAPVGGQAPKSGMPTWLKVIIIILVIFLLMGGCVVGCTVYLGYKANELVNDVTEDLNQEFGDIMEEVEDEVEDQLEDQITSGTTTQKMGDTFKFDGLEITLGEKEEVFVLNEETSAYNGKTFVKVPLKIKNVGTSQNKIKQFYYFMYYGETELTKIGYIFDDSIDSAAYLNPGESYDKYIYFLCENDGTYKIQFYDWTNTINLELNITR